MDEKRFEEIFDRVEEILDTFDFDFNDDFVRKEIDKMLEHMEKSIEQVSDFKISEITIDVINQEFKMTFIFEAPNIRFEDKRSYTIKIKY